MLQYIIARPVTCVEFSDLPQRLQWEVIGRHSQPYVDTGWTDCVLDFFAEDMLEKYGLEITEKDTCFCVADRGEFAAWKLHRVANEEKLFRALGFSGEELEILTDKIYSTFTASPRTPWGYHGQASDCRVDVYDADDYSERESFYDELERKVVDRWEEFCRDRARDLLSALNKEYEYLTSEEYFAEEAKENGWLFDVETGELYDRADYPDLYTVEVED